MEKLVFATNNPHKLQEVRAMLAGKFEVAGLKDIGCTEDIPETGVTLDENASIKSHYVLHNYQIDCFADDTGLEVDALGGRPGVYSARYAGEGASYEKNVTKLLKELADKTDRTARFRTVISLILNGNEYRFEGTVEGRIIKERRGSSGFGYDPVFIPEGYSQTFAEMDPDLKNRISHRARATQKFVDFLLSKG
ncbi:MAG: non-canonical purine NTP pyrophosphatase [Bacteroidetes bacterium]|nr:MAG: non-canonical purine NTP pyrophosphatase [Bacteroidota bacterium]RLD71474.1 MAG: non-canonical purine NTP pyrophosphatase [Bacteroidota bacterium]RLD87725.1 MAG: non-canonical purine NTP pyrophosphatase [Bacteroidota bacterium]